MQIEDVIAKAGYEVIDYKYLTSNVWAALLKDGSLMSATWGTCTQCDSLLDFTSRLNKAEEDLTEEDCKAFVEKECKGPSLDYEAFLAEEKWDSDTEELAYWMREVLMQYGFYISESVPESKDPTAR